MKKFYEVCKVLIDTDVFYDHGVPHASVTSIDYYTQKQAGSVEFDYSKIYDREDKYNDIAGFYHTHPSGMNHMSPIDIETMTQWVKCLGKSLICLIDTEQQLNGWVFSKGENGITHQPLHVETENDVNYNIWLDTQRTFWSSADFLLDASYFDDEMDEEEKLFAEVEKNVKILIESQQKVLGGIGTISETLQMILNVLKRQK